MAKLYPIIALTLLGVSAAHASPPLDGAEVRLPYGELARLLDRAQPPSAPATPPPALLAARLRLSLEAGKPVLTATLRTTSFGSDVTLIPLIGGDLTLAEPPADGPRIILRDGMLCEVSEAAATRVIELRLLPSSGDGTFSLKLPPCPSVMFETTEFGPEWSVAVKSGAREEIIGAGQARPLALTNEPLSFRLLGGEETRTALLPPEPSNWTWQHQALVVPGDGELTYHVLARASAAEGSGVSALLRLPADARNVEIRGTDLIATRRAPGEKLAMVLEWQTRGVLERELDITYRMPLRPLDPRWTLEAPAGEAADSTKSRFIVMATPSRNYAADGLTGPFPSAGLPAVLANELFDQPCYFLEGPQSAILAVTFVPRVETAEGVVTSADWSLKVEPDGALLTEGTLSITHSGAQGFVFDTPPGMQLLSCTVGGEQVAPVDRGNGVLEVALPAKSQVSVLQCAFTGKLPALDPVGGTLALALPKTPVFVRALTWLLDLPPAYQAETSGNLTRTAGEPAKPSRLRLTKNLSRDERPETNVFYQRTDLTR